MKTPRSAQVGELLALLAEGSGTPIPGTPFKRLGRNALVALRIGKSVATGKLFGAGGKGLAAADVKAIRKLVRSLGELKGVAMKMGQIFSYIDVDMPDELRELLAVLQTQSQPTPLDAIRATLREDLGEAANPLLDSLDPQPVSVASIGQVHRARLPDDTEVAVKVLHPGILDAIKADFKSAQIAPVMVRLFVPSGVGTVEGFIQEVEARLTEECDYGLEARHQQRFAEIYADHGSIAVPQVYPRWCGPRTLTTRWQDGLDLEGFLATQPDQDCRDRVGRTLFDFFMGTLYCHGLFHADPHPGNLLFDGGGRVTVLDYGCVREFDPPSVLALARLCHAVQQDRRTDICASLEQMGARPPGDDKGYAHARQLMRNFFGPMLLPGPRRVDSRVHFDMANVARDKMALMRLRLPGKLAFLFRIRFGLYALLDRLGAVCDWSELELSHSAVALEQARDA